MTAEKKPVEKGNKKGKPRAYARARDRFIRRLAESGNVADSCRKARLPSRTAYNMRKADPEFAALWKEAEEIAADGLVDEARRRAVTGWDEPVFQQGKQVGTIRRHSDRMLEILLKGHRPQYRENQPTANVLVNVGATLPPDRDELLLITARRLAYLWQRAGNVASERSKLLPAPATDGQSAGAAPVQEGSAPPSSPEGAAGCSSVAVEPERERVVDDYGARLSDAAAATASMAPGGRTLPVAAQRYRRKPWTGGD